MGWVIKSIGNTCSLATGGTPSRTKPEYFENGGIKWLVSGDIHQKEIFDCDGRISELGLQNSSARYLPKNSVMIALNGQGKTRGSVSILRTEATCNQSLVSICPNNTDELLPEFLYINLHGRYEEIRKMTGDDGNDRRGLNMPLIRSIQIPLPPIPEQQRIVAILDQAFADIEKARANAEKNLKNARELFDSYLNLHLLDVCTQARIRTLDTMCELIVDCEHKTAPIAGDGYPSIRTPNIGKGHLILDNVRRVSQETYNLWTRRAAPVGGDLILAREAPAGNVGVIPDGELVCLGQRTVLIRPDKANIDPKYLAMFLLHHVTQTRLLAHSTGATVQHINMKDIRNLAMPIFPEMQSQNVTVTRILKAQALAQSLHDKYLFKLASLDELKRSLLQKAFSGELTKTEGQAA